MKRRALAGALALFALACEAPVVPGDRASLTGPQAANATVKFIPVEGGCWAIEVQGARYEPVGLPAELLQDGLAIQVWFRPATDLASYCMVAPLVRVDSARAR